jgi:hypothetical protein
MVVQSRNTALSKGAAGAAGVSRSAFGNSSGGYGAITHALRHSDIWAAAAGQSGDMGFELCYLPDMPAVLRTLAGAQNSIEKWWQQLEAARKYPEGSFKVINALAMAVSYDSDPTQFLGIRLSVTFDTCEVIEERWANWWRQDPVVAIETQADNLRRLKALYIDCGKKDSSICCTVLAGSCGDRMSLASRTAARSSRTTIPASTTGWTRATVSRSGAVRANPRRSRDHLRSGYS